MLTPLSIIHNFSFIQCVLSIIDDSTLDTNIVLFMEKQNKIDIPVITTGVDEYKKSILFKQLDQKLLTTTKHIFFSSHEDMSTKNMRHFSELKKDTIFANVSSGEIKVGEFRKYEVKSILLGTCSDRDILNRSISNWKEGRKKWKYDDIYVCYTFDPPFTMNHTSLYRKGMVLDVHEMIHDLMGIKPIFRKMSLMEKGKKRKTEKRLQFLMRGRFCDYFLQGINGHLENKYDFTTPSFSDSLHWYTPTADLVPKWKYVYQILSKEVWYSWISTIFALHLLWYITNIILKRLDGRNRFYSKLWAVYKLSVEQDVNLKPNNITEVIIVSALIVESFVMNVAYKCKFIEFLSDDNYQNQFNSMEDIMDHDLKIGFLPLLNDMFKEDEKMIKYLKNHYVSCDFSFACIDRTAISKDMIVLRAKTKLSYVGERYTDSNGKFMLKQMGGIVSHMTFNSIFRRGHSLYPMVENELLKLQAHGFVTKVNKDYVKFHEINEDQSTNQTLQLKHLQISFFILVGGWVGSGIMFLSEIWTSENFRLSTRNIFEFNHISTNFRVKRLKLASMESRIEKK